MNGVLQRISGIWREFCKRRAYGAIIHPDGIAAQAEELARLAELALRSTAALSTLECRHLAPLADAMRRLTETVHSPEFCRLSADRRLALHRQLLTAREKLLASLQKTQISTEKLQ